MKISINQVKEIPSHLNQNFGVGVYGTPSEEILGWIKFHQFQTEKCGDYTNIFIGEDLNSYFHQPEVFEYVDGFSPNLNKWLHLGHVSNLVLAKCFQTLGVGKKFISILGDTLEGQVNKEDALKEYHSLCDIFNYHIDEVFFASEQISNDILLEDGTGDYVGTKIISINGKSIVAFKSNGSSTYFYQDVVLANKLNSKTLYLTGFEQTEHFALLKELFPHVSHLPMGLVTLGGKKMSSSDGNVIFFSEVIEIFKNLFGDNDKLIWNVLSGYILKSSPGVIKNINIESLNNPKESQGLYVSYVLAKLKSAGLEIKKTTEFHSPKMKFKLFKTKYLKQPKILFEEVVNVAKKLSLLYENHTIKEHPQNHELFKVDAEDLLYGMTLLGMYDIDKV